MRAAFVKLDCVLEDSGSPEGTLTPETIEAMRSLAENGLLTIVIDPRSRPQSTDDGMAQRVVEQIRAGREGSYVALRCPHQAGEAGGCWGPQPGLLHEAADKFDLDLNECYLICDALADVALARAVGCRPLLVLGGRAIGGLYGGREPGYKGFPMAKDLKTAIGYILHEEEAMRELGPFSKITPLPEEGIRRMIRPFSVKHTRQWLLVLVIGGLWLSLGIAYFFIHLYRIQPFPWQVWYITLQFIPRPLRGFLFLASGAILAAIAFRHLASLLAANSASKRRK